MKKILVSIFALSISVYASYGLPNVGAKAKAGLHKTAAGCNATTAVIDLDVNNVRSHLMDGGDMWWDIPTGTASYEVPKEVIKIHCLLVHSGLEV